MPLKFGKGKLSFGDPSIPVDAVVVEDAPCPLLHKGEGTGAVVQAPGQTGVVVGVVDCACPCQVKVAWGDCVHTFERDETVHIPVSMMRADWIGRTFESFDQAKEELGL